MNGQKVDKNLKKYSFVYMSLCQIAENMYGVLSPPDARMLSNIEVKVDLNCMRDMLILSQRTIFTDSDVRKKRELFYFLLQCIV